MANKQTFPQSIYPISGDVVSTDGDPSVTVVAIQGEPWSTTTPQTGQIPVQGADGVWHPEDPVVSGTDAPGSPSTANPVQVAGIDGDGLVRELSTDPFGKLQVGSPSIQDLLVLLIQEVRAMKTAVIALDNTLNSADFEAASYSDQFTAETVLN